MQSLNITADIIATVFCLLAFSNARKTSLAILDGQRIVVDGFNILLRYIDTPKGQTWSYDSWEDIVKVFVMLLDKLMEHCSKIWLVLDGEASLNHQCETDDPNRVLKQRVQNEMYKHKYEIWKRLNEHYKNRPF